MKNKKYLLLPLVLLGLTSCMGRYPGWSTSQPGPITSTSSTSTSETSTSSTSTSTTSTSTTSTSSTSTSSTSTSTTSTSTTSTSTTSTSTSSSTSTSTEPDYDLTVNFYTDFWHSDEPRYTMKWFMGEPLGKLPDEAKMTDADATDPLFPHFLGYSEYSSSLDDSKLWKFATEYKIGSTLNLYGIWVATN